MVQVPKAGLSAAEQAEVGERLSKALLNLPDGAEVDVARTLSVPEPAEELLSLEVAVDLRGVDDTATAIEQLMRTLLLDLKSMLSSSFVETYGMPSIKQLRVQESNVGGNRAVDDVAPSGSGSTARLTLKMDVKFTWGSEMVNSAQLSAIEATMASVVSELLSELHSYLGSSTFPEEAEIIATGAELRPEALSVAISVVFPPDADGAQRVAEELAAALWEDQAALAALVSQVAAGDNPEIAASFQGLVAEPTVARLPAGSSLAGGRGVLPSGAQGFTASIHEPGEDKSGQVKPPPDESSNQPLRKEVDADVSFSLVFSELDIAQLQPENSLEAFRRDIGAAMSAIAGEPKAETVLDSIAAGSVVATGRTTLPAGVTAVDSASKLFLHLLSVDHDEGGVLGADVLAAWGPAQVSFVSIDTDGALGGAVAGRADPNASQGKALAPQGGVVLEPTLEEALDGSPGQARSSSEPPSSGYTMPWWMALLAAVAVALALVLAIFALYTAIATRRKQKRSMRATQVDLSGLGNESTQLPTEQLRTVSTSHYSNRPPSEPTYGWQLAPSRPPSRGGGGSGGVVLVSNPAFSVNRPVDVEAARSMATTATSTPHGSMWGTEYVTTPAGVPGLGSIALPRPMLPPGKTDRWPHSSTQVSSVWGSPGQDHHPSANRVRAAASPAPLQDRASTSIAPRPQRLLPTQPAGYSPTATASSSGAGPSRNYLPDPFLVNASEPPVPKPPLARKVPRYASEPTARHHLDAGDPHDDGVPLRHKYGRQPHP